MGKTIGYVRVEGHLLQGDFQEEALYKGKVIYLKYEEGGIEGYYQVEEVGELNFDTVKGIPYLKDVKRMKDKKAEKMKAKGDLRICEGEYTLSR